MDFLIAYHLRLERNDKTFRKLANELIDKGCRVLIPNGLINFMKVFKDNKNCVISFGEVPYRWKISIEWKPSKDNGAGRVVKEIDGTGDIFTVDEVLNEMVDNWKGMPLTETYLKEYKNNNIK